MRCKKFPGLICEAVSSPSSRTFALSTPNKLVGERERERKRKRERERERARERKRERERESERKREDVNIHTHTQAHTDSRTHTLTQTYTYKHTHTNTHTLSKLCGSIRSFVFSLSQRCAFVTLLVPQINAGRCFDENKHSLRPKTFIRA